MEPKSRRAQLEQMLAAEPGDPFLRYAVALELAREGNAQEAVTALSALITDRPEYVPAYFQAGQILTAEGDTARAAELLRSGIAAARAQSDSHAAEEMSLLLAQIE